MAEDVNDSTPPNLSTPRRRVSRNQAISVALDPPLMAAVVELARAEHNYLSAIVRRALASEVERARAARRRQARAEGADDSA